MIDTIASQSIESLKLNCTFSNWFSISFRLNWGVLFDFDGDFFVQIEILIIIGQGFVLLAVCSGLRNRSNEHREKPLKFKFRGSVILGNPNPDPNPNRIFRF
jgi:hypothetical protein